MEGHDVGMLAQTQNGRFVKHEGKRPIVPNLNLTVPRVTFLTTVGGEERSVHEETTAKLPLPKRQSFIWLYIDKVLVSLLLEVKAKKDI